MNGKFNSRVTLLFKNICTVNLGTFKTGGSWKYLQDGIVIYKTGHKHCSGLHYFMVAFKMAFS